MTCHLTRTLLVFSGMLGLAIGLAILLMPHAFLATSGVSLGSDASLLSEIRAPGGFLIMTSLMMIAGAARQTLMRPGLFLAALVYGSFGLSRLVGLAFDGRPSDSLLLATLIELIVGAAAILALIRQPQTGGTSR